MFQCPKCGAEYTVLPDVCAQCGVHILPEDGIPDPFLSALEQETLSRVQQQEQRESYLKLRNEKAAQRQQEAEQDAGEEPETYPEPEFGRNRETQQEPASTPDRSSGAKSRKKKQKKLTILAMLGIGALFAAAGFSLYNSIKPENQSTDSYAFYLKEHTLFFYRDDTGESIRLTPNGKPDTNIPDSYMQKLTQVSEDGSRVYYTKNYNGDICTVAYRELSKPKTEHNLAEIRMFPDYAPAVTETGRPDETEAFRFADMLPPYIVLGDMIYYINSDGALCSRKDDSSETVLSNSVIRYWHVSGTDGIFFLSVSRPEKYDFGGRFIPDTCSLSATPWSVTESTDYPCSLYYCSTDPGIRDLYPFAEQQIVSWAIPYADSERYFYCCCQIDSGVALFQQSDLKKQNFTETIEYIKPDEKKPQLLCAYPDGSFYYQKFLSPQLSETENTFLYYFNRKQATNYELIGMPAYQFTDRVDICRCEPFAAICFQYLEKPSLYYGSQAVSLNMPAAGLTLFGKRVQFDTQYPVMIAAESDDADMLAYAFSSSVAPLSGDEQITFQFNETSEDSNYSMTAKSESGEYIPNVYYALLNRNNPTDCIPMPRKVRDGIYLAYQKQDEKIPSLYCLDPEKSELLLPEGEIPQTDRIIRTAGGMFGYSVTGSSVQLFQDHAMQWMNCENVAPDHWAAVGREQIFALRTDGELIFCAPEIRRTVDQADRLYGTGILPHESAETPEVSE